MEENHRIKRRVLRTLLLLAFVAALLFPDVYTESGITDCTVEAGETVPEAEAFRAGSAWLKELFPIAYAQEPQVDTAVPGEYAVLLTCMGKTFTRTVFVRDTVAPTAVARNITLTMARTLAPEDFLESVTDATTVTAAFLTAPDLDGASKQAVRIALTDEAGNTATVQAWLTLDLDVTAPTITGTSDITVYAGDTVSYRTGVTVTDDRDESPTLTVDTESVDLSTPGEYTATYIAADESGNETRQTITVTVLEGGDGYVSIAEIDALVESVLSGIITDDMTTIQQVRAVYDYIRASSTYTNFGNRGDYRQIGYRMLINHLGDCYDYFSAAKLLLEGLGIPNIDVVKVKNYKEDSEHYWSLVSVDGGKTYYHFDTCRSRGGIKVFLLTDAELDEYSKAHRKCYNRDTSLYPATPEEGPEE